MKALLTILIILLSLSGCSSYPKTNIGMVHDYIFQYAEKNCSTHQGLHYIVSIQNIEKGEIDGYHDYPCTEVYKIRCGDQTLLTYDDGAGFCSIPKMQLDETLKKAGI